jgi:hypothetical protein
LRKKPDFEKAKSLRKVQIFWKSTKFEKAQSWKKVQI